MSADQWPNVPRAVRDWLQSLPALAPLLPDYRIGIGAFDGRDAQIVVSRAGGGTDASSQAELDYPLIGIDVWAPTEVEAWAIAAPIIDALHHLSNVDVAGACLLGATVLGAVFLPDPTTDQPRYALTASLVTRKAA